MSDISGLKQVLLAALGLLLSVAGFELSGLDLGFQALLFDAAKQQWFWSSHEPIARLLLYDGPKRLLLVGLAGLGLSLLLRRFLPYMPRHARGIRIVFLCLILVPASVSGLKVLTNVACPRALAEFDGELSYVGLLHHYPADAKPVARQQCFPAAHASGGFALLALCFLFESPRNRRRAIYVGLGAGWVMGAYKIAIGDHFLSHTVVSMLWAWLVINLVVLVDDRLHRRSTGSPDGAISTRVRAAFANVRLALTRNRTYGASGQMRIRPSCPVDATSSPAVLKN